MRRHAKAATAGSTMRQASRLGRIFRGALATRGSSGDSDGSGASSRGRLSLLALAALALCLLLPAAPAQAAPETIAGPGSNAGQVDFPLGTAVHQASGDLYVAEGNNSRISKFDSDGDFLLAWGFGVRDGETAELQTCGPQATPPQSWCFSALPFFSNQGAGNIQPDAVAVDQASGDVYAADDSKRRITKFTSTGEFVFLVGKNVNATKVALEGGATQAEKNICTAASGDTCQNGESGSGANEFAAPRSLAVTPSGTVWVGDSDRLTSFDENGVPGTEITGGGITGGGVTRSLAIDSAGDFYVKSADLAGIRKLAGPSAPVPGELLETLDEAGQACTVTLDEADNVYIGDETSPYRFMKFNPAGEQIAQFGAGEVIGEPGCGFFGSQALAVGETAGKLYVASTDTGANSAVQAFSLPEPGPLVEAQGVEDVEPTTATLTARINPEGEETTYRFEYGTTTSYGQSTPTQTLAAEEFESEDVAAGLEELIPDTTYHFRVVATNHCNPAEPAEECIAEGEDRTFTTLPAVDILSQWATDVTATSARLHAEMDPLGVEAEAWLEWGTTEAYGQVVPFANLGDGFGAVSRHHFLTGLAPGTTYHYRFVARDERDGTTYTVPGPDKTFITQVTALGFELADDRAWEMVSPPQKFGALIGPHSQGAIQAAADGSSLAYFTAGSIEPAPEGNRAVERSSVLARRDSAGAWSSKDITPPHTTVTPVPVGQGIVEYKHFSSNLERSLLEPRDTTLLSPQASERTPYLRHNTEPGTYTPLVTGKDGFSNVPPGTEFGGDPTGNLGEVHIAGASPDLSHVALRSEVALAAGDPGQGLYEWEAGGLHRVSVLPEGEGGATVGAWLGSHSASVRKAVSDDGSRLFWSTPGVGLGLASELKALYVRDMDREETVRLDVVQPGFFAEGAANPVFQGANSEGTVAFFTDSHQLTEDAGKKGRDLYRCEVKVEGAGLVCDLTNLTAETAGAEESAEVQGLVLGMSDDGARAYFVAKGVLDTQPNAIGEGAIAGQPNLYSWQEGNGIRFIARLSGDDDRDWGAPSFRGFEVTADASPSGRYLTFMSQRSLTDYDNRDAKTGELIQEVFRYDAATDELICASCNPSDAAPVGLEVFAPGLAAAVDPQGLWQGRRLAAVLPQATKIALLGPVLHRPRAVHNNGRLFFNAADALVPADSNGNWDVYQHEPTGTGDCTSSAAGASIAQSAGGCVSLISSGTAEDEAGFLDASVGGNDVFFLTPAQLSITDEDQEVDVYDARVNGVAARLTPSAECLGEACQPAAQAPNDPTPASAAFKGQGNLRQVRNCGAISRRVGKLSRRAKAQRRKAKRANSPRAAKQLRRKAKRSARKAKGLSKRAKRCRRANRRAGR